MNNNYAKDIFNYFEKRTENILIDQSTFNNFKMQIEQWLSLKNELDKKLEIRLKEWEKQQRITEGLIENVTLTGTELRKVVNNYTQMRRKLKEFQDIDDIKNHFKKGYSIIERIREIFTQQEITYSIIYSGENKGQEIIYEANLTMEQLLPYLSLTMRDIQNLSSNRNKLSNSMSIYLSGSTVAKAAAAAIQKEEDNILDILSEIKNKSLWDSLVSFQKNKYEGIFNKNKEGSYKGNLGNLYEVYTNLTKTNRGGVFNFIGHEQGKQNTIGLATSLLNQAISDNIPFYQGGDYGLIQLKAVLGSSTRSLADINTIEGTLEKLKIAFNSSTKQELANNLKRIFVPDESKINDIIDKKVADEAIASIDKVIKEANLDIQ